MLPSKFGVNWPFGSGEEAKNRFLINANADANMTAIALPVLSCRRAKNLPACHRYFISSQVKILILEGMQHIFEEVLEKTKCLILAWIKWAQVSIHRSVALVTLGQKVRSTEAPGVGMP